MARPLPRLDRAAYALVRQKIDAQFIAESRRLDDAYYGTALDWDAEGNARARADDGWRHGVSHPYGLGGRIFDKAATAEASFARFNAIQGGLWSLHELCLLTQNILDGRPYGDWHLRRRRVETATTALAGTYEEAVEDARATLRAALLNAKAVGVDPSEIVPETVRKAVADYLDA